MLHDERLLIDGELVAATNGAVYENVNPATEEVLGVAADASAADVERAIGAARRGFDEISWATDVAQRARGLRQLHAAMRAELDGLKAMTVAEVGAPVMLTSGPQVETPIDFLTYNADLAERYAWSLDLGVAESFGATSRRWIEREPVGVVGAIITGSTVTGRRIMAAASATVKRVFLELGGKSAFVVLDDADLTAAIGTCAFQVCIHGGQGCTITTRLLLPRSRYDEGVEIARATIASMPYGDPTDPSVIMGTVAQEEIFGPVLVAIAYDDDDDAVRIANGTVYGLSGAVYGGDHQRATAVARRIRSGTMVVNGGNYYGADVPFGGYKQSGVGREMGVLGLEEYLQAESLAEPA